MLLIILGCSILFFLLIWQFMWQKTLLDTTRDRLFDVRENTRTWFLENGYSLSHPMYATLRNMLNCHLRNTENVCITRFIAFMVLAKRNQDYDNNFNAKIEDLFHTGDTELANFVSKTRSEAANILMTHMFMRSLFLTSAVFVGIIIRLISIFIANIKRDICALPWRQNIAFASIVISICSATPALRGNRSITMEKYSCSFDVNICDDKHSFCTANK